MSKDKGYTIYCPDCGRKLFHYDGKATTTISMKCQKCDKLATFTPRTSKVTLTKLPLRASGSGKRFY